jgi:hypothetical protein
MIAALLVAGFGFLLGGLLAIAFGFSIKEFSFGNTLMLMGAVAACTGVIMLGLWMVVRELKNVARRLGPGVAAEYQPEALPAAGAAPRSQAPDTGGFLFSRDQAVAETAGSAEPPAPLPATTPPPWHEESRDRARVDAPPAPEPAEAAPAAKPRRNLLFSSSSRKERERAQTRTGEPLAPDLLTPDLRPPPPPAPPPPEPTEAPSATFDDAWPKSERARGGAEVPPKRTPPRTPSTFADANAGPAPPRSEGQPPVTVLKSGVVDGMAYSLYSDGSIEAQMPEGMMRFASIDELRAHLEQRP